MLSILEHVINSFFSTRIILKFCFVCLKQNNAKQTIRLIRGKLCWNNHRQAMSHRYSYIFIYHLYIYYNYYLHIVTFRLFFSFVHYSLLSIHQRRTLSPFLCYLETSDILCHPTWGMGTKRDMKRQRRRRRRQKVAKRKGRIQIGVHSSNTLHNFYCQVWLGRGV